MPTNVLIREGSNSVFAVFSQRNVLRETSECFRMFDRGVVKPLECSTEEFLSVALKCMNSVFSLWLNGDGLFLMLALSRLGRILCRWLVLAFLCERPVKRVLNSGR